MLPPDRVTGRLRRLPSFPSARAGCPQCQLSSALPTAVYGTEGPFLHLYSVCSLHWGSEARGPGSLPTRKTHLWQVLSHRANSLLQQCPRSHGIHCVLPCTSLCPPVCRVVLGTCILSIFCSPPPTPTWHVWAAAHPQTSCSLRVTHLPPWAPRPAPDNAAHSAPSTDPASQPELQRPPFQGGSPGPAPSSGTMCSGHTSHCGSSLISSPPLKPPLCAHNLIKWGTENQSTPDIRRQRPQCLMTPSPPTQATGHPVWRNQALFVPRQRHEVTACRLTRSRCLPAPVSQTEPCSPPWGGALTAGPRGPAKPGPGHRSQSGLQSSLSAGLAEGPRLFPCPSMTRPALPTPTWGRGIQPGWG